MTIEQLKFYTKKLSADIRLAKPPQYESHENTDYYEELLWRFVHFMYYWDEVTCDHDHKRLPITAYCTITYQLIPYNSIANSSGTSEQEN